MKTLIALLLLIALLYACSSPTKFQNNRTADVYFDQLKSTQSTSIQNVRVAFDTIYKDFKVGVTESNIRNLYADSLYFNDTITIIENIDELVTYMTNSAAHINSTHVDILEVIKGENDYFIRWSMEMDFNAKGKAVHSKSIGITQLRFNDAGKIVFHQDFWDSSEAFIEHLPYIGYLVKKVKSTL